MSKMNSGSKRPTEYEILVFWEHLILQLVFIDFIFIHLLYFDIEPRASHILDNHCTTDIQLLLCEGLWKFRLPQILFKSEFYDHLWIPKEKSSKDLCFMIFKNMIKIFRALSNEMCDMSNKTGDWKQQMTFNKKSNFEASYLE